MRVLVVEDNQRLAAALAEGMSEEGYGVEVAHDGRTGLARAASGEHDAVVLDLMLPGLDGMTVLRRLRRQRSEVPVLVLTARDEIGDRVTGLDAGADDYLVKPFAFDELLARLRAVIRRRQGAASNTVVVADLEVDLRARTVQRAGQPIELSAREYQVLDYLVRNRGRVVSRDQLITALYEADDEPASNVVEVYIGQLRRKIDRDHARKLLHTRRGLGYVLEDRG